MIGEIWKLSIVCFCTHSGVETGAFLELKCSVISGWAIKVLPEHILSVSLCLCISLSLPFSFSPPWFHSLCPPYKSTLQYQNVLYRVVFISSTSIFYPLHLSCHSPCGISCPAWLPCGLEPYSTRWSGSASLSTSLSDPIILSHSQLLPQVTADGLGLQEVLCWPRPDRFLQIFWVCYGFSSLTSEVWRRLKLHFPNRKGVHRRI